MGKATVKADKVKFRLYITENATHSNNAIVNLKNLLQQWDSHNYQLEILDIHKHSHRAVEDKVLVAPTLLKVSAKDPARVVGDLSDVGLVKRTLELE